MKESSYKHWTTKELNKLKELASENKTSSEIAKTLNRSSSSIHKFANRNKIKIYHPLSDKYDRDVKRAVFDFYMVNSIHETCKKFNLKISTIEKFVKQVKEFDNIKLEYRKNEWRTDEIIALLQNVGFYTVDEISLKINRSSNAIKSLLKRRGLQMFFINGLEKIEAIKAFKPSINLNYIITRNKNNKTHYEILPWTTAEENMDKLDIDLTQRKVIIAMACFQRFLHGAKTNKEMSELLFEKVTE